MVDQVNILGTGGRLEEAGSPVAGAIVGAVRDALAGAGLSGPGAVDMVVTVASDILDGGMVATNSGIAGSYGREILTVPSSAGHALSAALSLIESGQVETVLLAGWGEGGKFAEVDGRATQADPFYARPVGAVPAALAVLQAQRLAAAGQIAPDDVSAYADRMCERAGRSAGPPKDAARWLKTGWATGAAAIVLGAGDRGLRVADIGTSFQPYCPAPADLDPAGWVADAIAAMSNGAGLFDNPPGVVEVGAPTPFTEVRALAGLLGRVGGDMKDPSTNASGGGAVAHFGPATGLLRFVSVIESLRGQTGGYGIAADLAGPIGQAVTVAAFENAGGSS